MSYWGWLGPPVLFSPRLPPHRWETAPHLLSPLRQSGGTGARGSRPPYWRDQGIWVKSRFYSRHYHPSQRGCKGIYVSVGQAQVPQTRLWRQADGLPPAPLGAPPTVPHVWYGGGSVGSSLQPPRPVVVGLGVGVGVNPQVCPYRPYLWM